MQQVLFWIPIRSEWFPEGIPVYAYGAMLFLAFLTCVWFASLRARLTGVNASRERIMDMAILLFVVGLLGARITYMIQYNVPIHRFFRIWEGGIVLYGGLIGGTLAFLGFYHLVLKPAKVGLWQMADVAAPTICLGVAIGRVGCLLNGCCYGNPASTDLPTIEFPLLSAPARDMLVDVSPKDEKRYPIQTLLGFTYRIRPLDERTSVMIVDRVEPGSNAEQAGIQKGDVIRQVKMLDQWVDPAEFIQKLNADWPRGRNTIQFKVFREGAETELAAYTPRSIGLHPTQTYETISMILLFFVLLAYYPLRTRDGEVFVVFMVGYAFHRFMNEILRTEPVEGLAMTLSQLISVIVLCAAILIEWYLRLKTPPAGRSIVAKPSA